MKKCPMCGSVNSDLSEICDCGFNFNTAIDGPFSFRKRKLGEVLSKSFKIYKENFLKQT